MIKNKLEIDSEDSEVQRINSVLPVKNVKLGYTRGKNNLFDIYFR